MKTPLQASEFAGTTVPVQGRLFPLKRLRDDSVPDAAVAADLNASELQVWNMGGQLDALNVWHVFHGLLGLKVTYLENAPARQDGPVRCPAKLACKTKLVWGQEVLWLHHRRHHPYPPCTKCGAAAHSAKSCPPNPKLDLTATLVLDGPRLDVTPEASEAAKLGTHALAQWLKDMDARLSLRSARAGGLASTLQSAAAWDGKEAAAAAADAQLVATAVTATAEEAATDLLADVLSELVADICAEAQAEVAEDRRKFADSSSLQRALRADSNTVSTPSQPEALDNPFNQGMDLSEDGATTFAQAPQSAPQPAATHGSNDGEDAADPWMDVEDCHEGTDEIEEGRRQFAANSSLHRSLRGLPTHTTTPLPQAADSNPFNQGMDLSEDRLTAFAASPPPASLPVVAVPTDDAANDGDDEDDQWMEVADADEVSEPDADMPVVPTQRRRARTTGAVGKLQVRTHQKERLTGRFGYATGSKTKARRPTSGPMVALVVARSQSNRTRERLTPRAQLGIQSFLQPPGQLGSQEIELVGTLPPPARDPSLADNWADAKEDMELTEVRTPPTGTCGEFSAYGTQWGLLDDTIQPVGVALGEAQHYQSGVYGAMDGEYEGLVETGVVDEGSLCSKLLGVSDVTDGVRARLRQEIRRAGMQPCDRTIHPRCWFGTNELRVLVPWLRQPLLVFDLLVGGGISAQLHTIARFSRDPADTRETVRSTVLSHAAAATWVSACKRARVIPLMMVLDHSINHFSALRADEERYREHALTPQRCSAMKKRLGTLLKSRGFYAPPARPPFPLRHSKLHPLEHAHMSSSISGDDSSSQQLVAHRGPGARAMTTHDDDADADVTPASSAVAASADFGPSSTGSLPESASGDLVVSPTTPPSAPLHPASLVTPQSPMFTEEYIQLLSEIHRQGPIPEADEGALAKANRDNDRAYKDWRKHAIRARPGLKPILADVVSAAAACDPLLHDTQLILSMLRSLPCVSVLAGRVRRDLFQRIGRDLIALGRARMLDRLSSCEDLRPEAKSFCADWARAFAGIPSADARWTLAQTQNRWDCLERLVPAPRLALHTWPLPDACDALLSWTAHDRRVYHTVAAAKAFANGIWYAPTEYVDGLVSLSQQWLPTGAQAPSGSPRRH